MKTNSPSRIQRRAVLWAALLLTLIPLGEAAAQLEAKAFQRNPNLEIQLDFRDAEPGTTFLRRKQAGTYDPVEDRYDDEYALIGARTLDPSSTPPGYLEKRLSAKPARRYEFNDPAIPDNSVIPPGNYRIHTFNERSVAASDWELVLTLADSTTTYLNTDDLNDIIIRIKHFAGTQRTE